MNKSIKTFLAALLFTLSNSLAFAGNETGTIKGTIADKSNQESVPFANIIIEDSNIGTTTDFDGNFNLNISPGTYNIIVSYIGYKTDTVKNIAVQNGDIINIQHFISSDSQVLQSVDLVVKQDRESETALLVNQRKATEIVQNIGSQELSRKGVSNVADGLKKVSGISTVSSKFVVVRGLGDRYNAALLNGLPVPSTNPDMKVPELNLFPTAITSNIKVTKTFSSQYYGGYSGGMIDIQTKSYSEEPLLKVSLSSGFNSQTIGRTVTGYQGGRFDYFGFDDGVRAQPKGTTNSDANPLTFNNKLTPVQNIASPNTSFSLAMGNSKSLNGGATSGYLLSIYHSYKSRWNDGLIRTFNKQGDRRIDYTFEDYTQSTNSSVLGTYYYAPNSSLRFTYNLVGVGTSSNATRQVRGYYFDQPNNIYSRRNTFQRNTILINQVIAEKDLENTELKAAAGYSIAQNRTPDRNQLVYLYEEGAADNEYLLNSRDRLENQRFYSQLGETEMSAYASAKTYLHDTKESKDKEFIDYGIQFKNKVRTFDYQQYLYDLSNFSQHYSSVDYKNPDAYLNNTAATNGAISVEEVINPASAYTAALMVGATYVNASLWFGPRFQFLPGIRAEYANQNIQYKDQAQPKFERTNTLAGITVLPHLSIRFNANEKMALRYAGSKTVSRPGFKEVAPFEYTEVFAGAKTRGNPVLNNGQNYNNDIKFEFYPHSDELISVSVFNKYLLNPIEKNMLATASGQLQSFQNADYGIVTGVEFEYNKKLSYLFENKAVLKDLVFGTNISFLKSAVTINDNDNASSVVTNTTHPLQGASPILLNVDLSYSPANKGSITLAYNWFGERLYAVGIQGLGDIYEQSFGTLNLIGSLPIKDKWQASVRIKNVLNPEVNTVQYIENEVFTINSFKRGIDISVGISYKFK